MNIKRIAAIALLICGVGLMLFSNYISNQVAEGRTQIKEGQSTVDTANSLFSLNPVAKEAGKMATGSSQRKIDEGRKTADEYSALASKMQIGGVIALILGAGFFLLSFRKKGR
jgi:hypothetical protein